ncbi:unnamed protein product [Ceutorhynchus assimilis]|uniref:AAA+ ATPase domain-containing protein n=1 Tax=Ceutorhynchus assimilis TaxID=467358 RepID=A0A9N9MJK6_9CUCU|nr:unnamed protein product [Ceutorhynchus assimilis]
MQHNLAIYIKAATKSYDSNKILENLSMSVERGTIYGLLGASGCGKTTLLNCIIGRKPLDNGQVWVFGEKTGTKDCGIPGPRVGYMPQEIALVPEYTVKETIFFFGRIANMDDKDISDRYYQLSRLLELPPHNQFIKNCSGGQQRRISLASAIVHEPELLILDEPTVGVDSLLREKIWSYLLDLVQVGITVVLTTHYVEECKGAHKVGFLRNGSLLAELSPQAVLTAFNCDTLEQAFLIICKDKDAGKEFNEESLLDRPSMSSSSRSFDISNYESSENINNPTKRPGKKVRTFLSINAKRLQAQLHKNWIQFIRNYLGLFFFGILPLGITLFFVYCIGGDIKRIPIGTVNAEVPGDGCKYYNKNMSAIIPDKDTYKCTFQNLSCRFLEYLDHPMVKQIRYEDNEEVLQDIELGKLVGYLFIPANFSESYQIKVDDILAVNETILEFSSIKGFMDMSNKPVGGTMKEKLIELYLDFQKDLYKDCMWDERTGQSPMKEEYLFGKKDDSFLVFMIPALILTFGYNFSIMMTSQIIVSEKSEGTWDRLLASGVSTLEVTLGHLLLQLTMALSHTFSPIIVIVYIYGLEHTGSVFHMSIVSYLTNICGLVTGFWLSFVCKNHTQAHYLNTAIIFPVTLLTGLMWPVESFPHVLQIIAKCLPMTLQAIALRNIIKKGWSIWRYEVVLANLIPLAWILVMVVMSIVHIKRLK